MMITTTKGDRNNNKSNEDEDGPSKDRRGNTSDTHHHVTNLDNPPISPMMMTTTINDCHDNCECCTVEMVQHKEEEVGNRSIQDGGDGPAISTPSAYPLPAPPPLCLLTTTTTTSTMTMTKGRNHSNNNNTPPHYPHHLPTLPHCLLPLTSSHSPHCPLSPIIHHYVIPSLSC